MFFYIHVIFQSITYILKEERKQQRLTPTKWLSPNTTAEAMSSFCVFFSPPLYFLLPSPPPRKATQILLVQFLLPSYSPNQHGTFLLLEGLLYAFSHLYELGIKCLQGASSCARSWRNIHCPFLHKV